jgi:phosphoribosylanthranilate isomerase
MDASMTRRTLVKMCCISSHEEAELAISAGASALGLVSAMLAGLPSLLAGGLNAGNVAETLPRC